jgi:hypothetical protein
MRWSLMTARKWRSIGADKPNPPTRSRRFVPGQQFKKHKHRAQKGAGDESDCGSMHITVVKSIELFAANVMRVTAKKSTALPKAGPLAAAHVALRAIYRAIKRKIIGTRSAGINRRQSSIRRATDGINAIASRTTKSHVSFGIAAVNCSQSGRDVSAQLLAADKPASLNRSLGSAEP